MQFCPFSMMLLWSQKKSWCLLLRILVVLRLSNPSHHFPVSYFYLYAPMHALHFVMHYTCICISSIFAFVPFSSMSSSSSSVYLLTNKWMCHKKYYSLWLPSLMMTVICFLWWLLKNFFWWWSKENPAFFPGISFGHNEKKFNRCCKRKTREDTKE